MVTRKKRLIVGGNCRKGHAIASERDIYTQPSGTRSCRECARVASRKYHVKNPEKVKAMWSSWRDRNPDAVNVYSMNSRFLFHELPQEKYWEMVKEQNGVCAICNRTNGDKNLFIDHDHATGAVRGLLCSKCNFMLGQAEDNSATLSSAMQYLNKYL